MKKTYEIPSVEFAQLNSCTIICTSPGVLNNNGKNTGDLLESEVTGG